MNIMGITELYDSLTGSITNKLDTLYTANKIDAETYAALLSQSFDKALQLSVSAVQEQERIDKDNAVKDAEIANTTQVTANLLLEAANIGKQGTLLDEQANEVIAKISLTGQQEANLIAEALNIPKQGALVDAQTSSATAQALQIQAQTDLFDEQVIEARKRNELNGHVDQELNQLIAQTAQVNAQIDQTIAQAGMTTQQTANLSLEAVNIPKQGAILDAQKIEIDTKTDVYVQDILNKQKDIEVMTAQICKLDAEYDQLISLKTKTDAESSILAQKKTTEEAQTNGNIGSPDSVIGRQKALYHAQTEGYKRDAEQKAAKIMVDTWNVRRTTTPDEAAANTSNGLDDASIKQSITKLLSGLN